MTDILLVRDRDFSLRAAETIREAPERPHLLLRVTVVGPYWPHRDAAPFVRVVGARRAVAAYFTEISPDQTELRGYFPADLPLAGRVEFGYASQVMGSVPVGRVRVARLDPARIEGRVHRVTRKAPGAYRVRR